MKNRAPADPVHKRLRADVARAHCFAPDTLLHPGSLLPTPASPLAGPQTFGAFSNMPLTLAVRAVMGSATGNHNAANGSAADPARFPRSSVDHVLDLEQAPLSRGVDIVRH